jgi:hypothetical protein
MIRVDFRAIDATPVRRRGRSTAPARRVREMNRGLTQVSVDGKCNRGLRKVMIDYFESVKGHHDTCLQKTPSDLHNAYKGVDAQIAEYKTSKDRHWNLKITSTRGPLRIVGAGGLGPEGGACPGPELSVDVPPWQEVTIEGVVPGNECSAYGGQPWVLCLPDEYSKCKFDIYSAGNQLGYRCPPGYTCDVACAAKYEGFDHFTCANSYTVCCKPSSDPPEFTCNPGEYCDLDCASHYASFDGKTCANAAEGYCCKPLQETHLGTVSAWWYTGHGHYSEEIAGEPSENYADYFSCGAEWSDCDSSVSPVETWPSTLAPEQGVEWPHTLAFFERSDAIWDYFNSSLAKTGTCHLKITTPEASPPPSDWKSSCGGVYPLGCHGDCHTEKGMYWKGDKYTCGSFPGLACELRCHYDPPKTSCP